MVMLNYFVKIDGNERKTLPVCMLILRDINYHVVENMVKQQLFKQF